MTSPGTDPKEQAEAVPAGRVCAFFSCRGSLDLVPLGSRGGGLTRAGQNGALLWPTPEGQVSLLRKTFHYLCYQ